MKKALTAVISALFLMNSEATLSPETKNIPEAINLQSLVIDIYFQKTNNLTEVEIANDGSCGYGALLLAAYFDFLYKGHLDKASALQDAAISAINKDNNPARKYLLERLITALNAGDMRASFVKFLIDSTVMMNVPDVGTNPSLEQCIAYFEKIKELPSLTDRKDMIRFYPNGCFEDTCTELLEQTLAQSNNVDNIQYVVRTLESLDYINLSRVRLRLFDAIAYVLGFNFQVYDKIGKAVSQRNFGFESQLNIRCVAGMHVDVLLSDAALSALNTYGITHQSARWFMRLISWIHDVLIKPVYIQTPCFHEVIKTEDGNYFVNQLIKSQSYPFVLELGIGFAKILRGNEAEGKEIVSKAVSTPWNSQDRLFSDLANSSVIQYVLSNICGTSKIDSNNIKQYLEYLDQEKFVEDICALVAIHNALPVCFYDQHGKVLYKRIQLILRAP